MMNEMGTYGPGLVKSTVHRAVLQASRRYLAWIFLLYYPSRALHSASDALQAVPCIDRLRKGGKAFSFLAAKVWDKLPQDLLKLPLEDVFRRKLKT
ncbi:hypothetical protein NDU88_001037 [Pleurodeles waltl]|uniref:Uncharacterized protein n=1 Tax=Pleurodeles waltl TaxID=8319 RepID=A0AAV7MJT9_PLEWA|nr:hypothetical protein NDU88_001037 [Pleurodeles waltl]